MKTRVRAVISFMCVFLSWVCTSAAAKEEWKVLQQSSYGDTFSYDAASIKHTDGNTVTVRAGSDSSKYLYEIDCKNNKARLLEGTGANASEWFNILGVEELLRKAVCP